MRRITIVGLGIMSFGVSAASGQVRTEESKITVVDGEAGDQFGSAVAVDGGIMIVGAMTDDDGGSDSGSAYVIDLDSKQVLHKLIASDAAALKEFGTSVAISGNIALVGAPNFGSFDTAAYLFDLTTGNELFKLNATTLNEFDFFGFSVAISGNYAVVGAPIEDTDFFVSGSAYVFDVTTGEMLYKLNASDVVFQQRFGISVGVSGDLAIVGAWGVDDNGINSGAAYVFDLSNGQQIYKLLASDGQTRDNFGLGVAISGDRAVVGAPLSDSAGADSGSAYVFDLNTGLELFRMTASDGAANGQFGLSVAISDSRVLIGSRGDADSGAQSGSAYVFDLATGTELFELVASDAGAGDELGWSVSLSGDRAYVGAIQDDETASDAGAAYVFDLSNEIGCPADLTGDGDLNFFDVSAFLAAFGASDSSADFTGDGEFNFFDVSAFLQAFGEGCP